MARVIEKVFPAVTGVAQVPEAGGGSRGGRMPPPPERRLGGGELNGG